MKNGFDLTGALVPPDRILPGGPLKDGMPAIDAPKHELVNDHFADGPVLISFCPLCGTGVAYRSSAGSRKLIFRRLRIALQQ